MKLSRGWRRHAAPASFKPDDRARGRYMEAGKASAVFRRRKRAQHPNGMRFTARDAAGGTLLEYTYLKSAAGL